MTWHGTGLQICNDAFDNISQSWTTVDKWFSKDIYWANTFHGQMLQYTHKGSLIRQTKSSLVEHYLNERKATTANYW